MKVVEIEDRHGRCPLVFTGYKNICEVRDYLWQHYTGYHFVTIWDCTHDEYEDLGNALYVYFSDEAIEEIAIVQDYEIKKKR